MKKNKKYTIHIYIEYTHTSMIKKVNKSETHWSTEITIGM